MKKLTSEEIQRRINPDSRLIGSRLAIVLEKTEAAQLRLRQSGYLDAQAWDDFRGWYKEGQQLAPHLMEPLADCRV